MNPSEILKARLGISFNSEITEIVENEIQTVAFPLGHTLLWEGDTAVKMYLIIKGVIRGYYIDSKGNDITKCFSMEGDFISTEGFRTSLPSSFTIECLEECKCLQIPYDTLRNIMTIDKGISDLVSTYFQLEVSRQEEKSKSLMLSSAEERYLKFCSDYPSLLERVALKYIASYIGVRPASLSRIRKQSKNSEN